MRLAVAHVQIATTLYTKVHMVPVYRAYAYCKYWTTDFIIKIYRCIPKPLHSCIALLGFGLRHLTMSGEYRQSHVTHWVSYIPLLCLFFFCGCFKINFTKVCGENVVSHVLSLTYCYPYITYCYPYRTYCYPCNPL